MSGTFSDKGLAGASHHAVIPNHNRIETLREVWPRLSADERQLFDVIARAYLAAVMPDFRYRQTTMVMEANTTARASRADINADEKPIGQRSELDASG